LDCLQYVHKNGWEFDQAIYDMAIAMKHLQCVKYILDSGFKVNTIKGNLIST